jgi:hypothetical protein
VWAGLGLDVTVIPFQARTTVAAETITDHIIVFAIWALTIQ